MQDRRNFIKNASLISLGGILAGKSDLANAAALSKFSVDTGKKKIGLQLSLIHI